MNTKRLKAQEKNKTHTHTHILEYKKKKLSLKKKTKQRESREQDDRMQRKDQMNWTPSKTNQKIIFEMLKVNHEKNKIKTFKIY